MGVMVHGAAPSAALALIVRSGYTTMRMDVEVGQEQTFAGPISIVESLLGSLNAQDGTLKDSQLTRVRESLELVIHANTFLLDIDRWVSAVDVERLERTCRMESVRIGKLRTLLGLRETAIRRFDRLQEYWTNALQDRLEGVLRDTEALWDELVSHLEDVYDVPVAQMRLQEIDRDPGTLVRGDELRKRLREIKGTPG